MVSTRPPRPDPQMMPILGEESSAGSLERMKSAAAVAREWIEGDMVGVVGVKVEGGVRRKRGVGGVVISPPRRARN